MNEPEQTDLWEGVHRLGDVNRETARLLREAEALYAPAELRPASSTGLLPRRTRRPLPPFDRWVTYPLWALWVTASHATIALACAGTVLFGAAILVLLGNLIDNALGLPVPVATCAAAGVGLLAATGTFATVARSWRDRIKNTPW